MKIRQTLKKILTLFCASIILFSAAGCEENRYNGKNLHFEFESFKDFSTFHSEYAKLYDIKSLAFNLDDISFAMDKKRYPVSFLNALGNKNKDSINKDNLIDYLDHFTLYGFYCSFKYNYDKNLAEIRYYSENNEQEDPTDDKNGYWVLCVMYSVWQASNTNEIMPTTDNLSYVLVENDSVTYRNYYKYELVANGKKFHPSNITIALNKKDDDLAERLVQSLVKSAVVLK